MSGKKHKLIRRAAREELAGQPVPQRDLVVGVVNGNKSMRTAFNDPFSLRGFTRGLKKAMRKTPQFSSR